MANAEQLAILEQGVRVWNGWRKENSYLRGVDLRGVKLQGANLRLANLIEADLTEAFLPETDLRGADLTRANLTRANLSEADLRQANLTRANLNDTIITYVNFRTANLTRANLSDSDLRLANFTEANLTESNFSTVISGHTTWGGVDLKRVRGLERVSHHYPSTIGTNTLALSQGRIPTAFLRGCGLSDWEIEAAKLYNPDLSNDERNHILYKIYDLQASQAIQLRPLFISYSHSDGEFVDKVGSNLTKRGIRYWRDIHDMKAGRMEKQIDRAIELNPTVLLILSKKSLKSDWVEHEVRRARQLEKKLKRDVLCPLALDNNWKKKNAPWPKRIMEQIMEYNILDFSAWKDDSKFDGMFRKLIDGLELFYKG